MLEHPSLASKVTRYLPLPLNMGTHYFSTANAKFTGCLSRSSGGATQHRNQNGACGSQKRERHGKVSLGGDGDGGVGGDDAVAFGDGVGEICRGLFAVCGFSDNTFALLAS